jgi:hypothetical protein
MDKDNLPGLSPLWLISLGLVLGCLIVVMIPVSIATGDNIKSSDWIGFAGSVTAGAVTLIAAGIAWFAVQKQIRIQREIADSQAAIERFNILQAQLGILENESRLTRTISVEAKWAVIPQTSYLAGPLLDKWQAEAAMVEYDKRAKSLSAIVDEFTLAGTQRWTFGGGPTRVNLYNETIQLQFDLTKAALIVKNAIACHSTQAGFRQKDLDVCLAINFSTQRDAVLSACATHDGPITFEIERLSGLLRTVREQAGL